MRAICFNSLCSNKLASISKPTGIQVPPLKLRSSLGAIEEPRPVNAKNERNWNGKKQYILLDLLADLHRRILRLAALVAAEVPLAGADGAGLLGKVWDGRQVEVAAQVPEEGAADADEGAVRERRSPSRHCVQRLLVHHYLVVCVVVNRRLHIQSGGVMELPHRPLKVSTH